MEASVRKTQTFIVDLIFEKRIADLRYERNIKLFSSAVAVTVYLVQIAAQFRVQPMGVIQPAEAW